MAATTNTARSVFVASLLTATAPLSALFAVKAASGPQSGGGPFWTFVPSWLAGGLAATAIAVGGLFFLRYHRLGAWLATGGLVGVVAASWPFWKQSPAAAFAILLGAGTYASLLWPPADSAVSSPLPALRGNRSHAAAWGGVFPALLAWLVAALGVGHGFPVLGTLGIAACCSALALVRGDAWSRVEGIAAACAWAAGVTGSIMRGFVGVEGATWFALCGVVPPLLLGRPRRLTDAPSAWAGVLDNPARLLVTTFGLLSLVGTLLLGLPAAAEAGRGVGWMDAAFTAISATCVTGLVVVDTPTVFSPLGEATILLLIQTGGLGIMTFSTAALAVLQRRPSMRHETAVAGLLGAEGSDGVYRAVKRMLLVTAVAETLGAIGLSLRFLHMGEPVAKAAWRGTFTAVSAFCNAGFALQTDSLIAYRSDPVILHLVAGLIIVGGLGPMTVLYAPRATFGRRAPLQSRIAWNTTVLLLVVPATLFAIFEWTGQFAHLAPGDRLHNAWFQSVTTRTAGFNTVDVDALRPATLVLTGILMFIGGSPGSTAGGVKTTTFALLVLAVVAALRSRSEIEVYGYRVAHASVYRAAAVTMLSAVLCAGALVALLLTQRIPPGQALFEVVSAMGTVGLSTGATVLLDDVGKVIIMVCMFAGRVGPLALFLGMGQRRRPRWSLPVQDLVTG